MQLFMKMELTVLIYYMCEVYEILTNRQKHERQNYKKNITKHHRLLLKTKLPKKKKNYKTSMAIRVDCCMWCCVCQDNFFIYKRI